MNQIQNQTTGVTQNQTQYQTHNELFPAGAVPIPNRVFDEFLPKLSDCELRLLLVCLRSTLGWRVRGEDGTMQFKNRDWMTHSQLVKRTGRSSGSVSSAVQSLVEKGLIVTESSSGLVLSTPEQRRRYIGRIFFRPGDWSVDMWRTPQCSRMGRTGTTTDRRNNIRREKPQAALTLYPTPTRTGSRFQTVADILRERR